MLFSRCCSMAKGNIMRFCARRTVGCVAPSLEMLNIQNEEDFSEKVLKCRKSYAIVDFHATWCSPCKLMGPRLEEVISNHKLCKDILFAKVDVDDLNGLAEQYDVCAVPTVIGFKNGTLIKKMQGLQEKDRIEDFINQLEEK